MMQAATQNPDAMRGSARNRLNVALRPRLTKYIPHRPTPRQAAFLLLPHKEGFYGGAAGGGKSDSLLMGALQYVDIPGYAALLIRRTSNQLTKAEGLIPRSHEWLDKTDAVWNEKKLTWTFPSGATMEFGHVQYDKDKYNFQGPAYQYIGFDELTQFSESTFRYFFSRLRRPNDPSNPLSRVPLRIRGAGNPGGRGHVWVKRRYIVEGRQFNRPFIPAKLEDNPFVDQDAYDKQLAELDPVTRAQLRKGDWAVNVSGNMFKRDWFGNPLQRTPDIVKRVRFWDLAHSAPKNGSEPDYTVGLLYGLTKLKTYVILEIERFQLTAAGVKDRVRSTAQRDGHDVPIRMEQEPAAGKDVIEQYSLGELAGFNFKGAAPGSAEPSVRWGAISASAERGHVAVMESNWNGDFFDEIEVAPFGDNDDQLTAWAGAHKQLCNPYPEAAIF